MDTDRLEFDAGVSEIGEYGEYLNLAKLRTILKNEKWITSLENYLILPQVAPNKFLFFA